MTFGFIGAGKVGFSMGKFLTERGIKVTGYYNRTPQSSLEAADFTNTRQYFNIRHLVEDSDAIVLAVPDGAITAIWEQLKMLPIQNKLIIHFSGSLSSMVFSEIERYHAYGYSIHPLLAVHDKYTSYQDLARAMFTLEGHPAYLNQLKVMFENFGNTVEIISARDKVRYHASAAMASNLYVGLVNLCEEMLRSCGFSARNAHKALAPLILGNVNNIVGAGTSGALTGPIERNDVETILTHLEHLTEEEKEIYLSLSLQVLKVAKAKHPERNYDELEGVLQR